MWNRDFFKKKNRKMQRTARGCPVTEVTLAAVRGMDCGLREMWARGEAGKAVRR